MPRNVRNFWIEGQIDGRPSKVIGGPQAKNGGFRLTVYIRHDGGIVTALHVQGTARADGALVLMVEPGSELMQLQYGQGSSPATRVRGLDEDGVLTIQTVR